MGYRLVKKRRHPRQTKSGRLVTVREHWAMIAEKVKGARLIFKHTCKLCDCDVVSVPMRNGGWAHYEGGEGLSRVKHVFQYWVELEQKTAGGHGGLV